MSSIRESLWARLAWAGVAGALLLLVGCGGRGTIPEGLELLPEEPVPTTHEYLIDVGDALDIDFFYQPELSRRVVVRPDGRITVPGLGEMDAAGRRPGELAKAITEGFGSLLKDPLVTVSVSDMAASRVFLVGEIRRPGGYQLRGRMTLATAVSEAGGFTRHAKMDEVTVVRRTGREKPVGFRVDARGLEREGALTPEVFLAPYDIVYVPRSNFGLFRDAVVFVLQPGLYYILLLLLDRNN